MTTINLYQPSEEDREKVSARRANSGFIFSIGILVAVLLLLGGLNVWASVRAQQSQKLLDQVTSENSGLVSQNNIEGVIDAQYRLDIIKANLKDQTSGNIEEALNRLASTMVSGVFVSSYSYKSNHTLDVTVNANNFVDISRQILNFKQSEYFTNVSVGNITRGEKQITADLKVTLKQ
ncbi:MAG TPA: PilN domain-containing protein [Patescibacteria group bacterium]